MRCGIVGKPLSGKSTLFSLLTGSPLPDPVQSRREVQHGIAQLPDPRRDELARVSRSRKIVPATVEYLDIPGAAHTGDRTEPYPPALLGELRAVSMLALVLRDFAAAGVPHPSGSIDPARDLLETELEFILADLATAEKRLERLARMHDEASRREADLLERCRDGLAAERPLRELAFDATDDKALRGYAFLSLKPLLVVLNLGEEGAAGAGARLQQLQAAFPGLVRQVGWVSAAGEIEAEIAQLDPEERAPFMADLGYDLPALDRIIRATFDLMGMITFFTTGDKDTTAWAIPSGSNAVTAAGAIHDDIARGFIRAEVCRWDDLVAAGGSHARLKEQAKLHLEGKDYIVKDGDVINVRFGI
ncbi:MAG: redox-regulated ATPase YchF [Calditrichaeota bacterium]|nr:redox-regulated ATPase YchF [Calditrichota bacterium]